MGRHQERGPEAAHEPLSVVSDLGSIWQIETIEHDRCGEPCRGCRREEWFDPRRAENSSPFIEPRKHAAVPAASAHQQGEHPGL